MLGLHLFIKHRSHGEEIPQAYDRWGKPELRTLARILANTDAKDHPIMTRAAHIIRHFTWISAAFLLTVGAQAQEKQDDWPLVFTSGADQVQVFRPQPETFDGTSFTARAAVALQRPEDSTPVFGAIWGNGVLAVDRTDRMGTLQTFKVTDARFPGVTDVNELSRIKEMLSAGIVQHAAPIPIDWLVAALEEEKQMSGSYENTPPEIIYRDKPSILVFVDGDPIYEEVKNKAITGGDPVYAQSAPAVERVVNTPFFLVRAKGGTHWLHGSGLWYSARNIQGPWANEKKAPDYLERLAAEVDTSTTVPPADGVIPEIIVTMKPVVLLDINGEPKMEPFDNSSLMYVTNTDKDLFLDIPTQEYYFLASGRWYASKNLRDGPWRYVAPDALPAGFASVPEGSAKDGILAHVAGTPAAREAVRDASIPQTAQVDRRTATVSVSYDGAPQFRQIPGTNVYSAENASTVVLRINGVYHVCDNAVWYEGDSPDGPWVVSTSVPSEVNDIPASDPNYRVRYVYIYDSTPDVVFTGYTPGYLGSYVQAGTVIYGTGYYYNPWRSSYWYPRPYTWGFNMHYNPWYGWGFGASWGYTWFYPSWNYYGYYRPYSWGWWGPYAYCPPVATYYGYGYYGDNYRQGYYGHRPSMSSRGTGADRLVADQRSPVRTTDLYRNHSTPGVRPSETNRSILTNTLVEQQRTVAEQPDRTREMEPIRTDHFTDSKGNVYRNEAGRTEEFRDGRWTPLTPEKVRDLQPPSGADQRDRSTVTPQRDTPMERVPQRTAEPGQHDRQVQPTTPSRTPTNPYSIQQERSRGNQRVNDYRGYQQDRQAPPPQRTTPTPRPAPTPRTQPTPQRSAPTTRPSAPPVRSTPSSPSRGTPGGGGGGGGGTRTPR